MIAYTNRTQTLDVPGVLPMHFEAHYDVEIYSDHGEAAYKIDLGYIEWTMAGKQMLDMEGGEVPKPVREMILAGITVTQEEMHDALNEAEEQAQFEREHAVGM
jgi:hypothetical protein